MIPIVLALARRFWPYLAGAAALIAAAIAFHFYMVRERQSARTEQYAADKIVMDKFAADVRDKMAAARAADQKHADDVAAARAKAAKDAHDAYAPQIADYRSRIAAYTRLHPTSGADQGRVGYAYLPEARGGAPGTDGPDRDTVVPVSDLDACAQAIGRLQAVQGWWDKLRDGPR